MIDHKKLSPEQIEQLKNWASAGLDMNGMQKKINEELGMHATFMDTRFLLLDLGITLISPAEEESPKEPAAEQTGASTPPGTTSVTIDEITPPHALISGKVTFSSGVHGTWFADKMGRIEWTPIDGEPTQDDLQDFNKELQRTLRSRMGAI